MQPEQFWTCGYHVGTIILPVICEAHACLIRLRPALRSYVPSHLHHMVFELVKNSLRAVGERYERADTRPPDINVVVATGREDVTIKVRTTAIAAATATAAAQAVAS